MARLVGNLLQFSRPGRDQVSTVDVPEEVRKTIELTEPHLRRLRVAVEPGVPPGVPTIYADRQQLRQVLLNLFTNAGDAMPKGGRLTPRVRPGRLPGADLPAVVIEVADTGVGIPAGRPAAGDGPVLHHQGGGEGDGAGAGHLPADRRRSTTARWRSRARSGGGRPSGSPCRSERDNCEPKPQSAGSPLEPRTPMA